MRVIVDIADEGITGAKALDGFLENDLPVRRLVGIEIDRAKGMVVGVVTCDKHLAFAVKVEVGKADMAVSRVSIRWRDGLVDGDGIQGGIGAAGDVYVVDGVAANQFLLCIT